MKKFSIISIVILLLISLPASASPLRGVPPVERSIYSYWDMEDTVTLETGTWVVDIYEQEYLQMNSSGDLPVLTEDGKIGYGLDFSGDDNLYVPDVGIYNYSGAPGNFEFCGWFFFREVDGYIPLLGMWGDSGGQRAYILYLDDASNHIAFAVNGSNNVIHQADSPHSIVPGNFYMICAWHNGDLDEIGVSVNGEAPIPGSGTVAHSTGIRAVNRSFFVGYFENNTGYTWFDGIVDELGLWQTKLTDEELQQLYERSNPSQANLIGDGGMEQQPTSSFWYSDTSTGSGRADFGRLNTTNWIVQLAHGPAACGGGMQSIGNINNFLGQFHYADVSQNFTLPQASQVYFNYDVRGYPVSGGDSAVSVRAYIYNRGTAATSVLSTDDFGRIWTTKHGSTPTLPAGNYRITIQLTPERIE